MPGSFKSVFVFSKPLLEQSVNLGTIILTNCFCLTRLETRTKESNRFASLLVFKLFTQ